MSLDQALDPRDQALITRAEEAFVERLREAFPEMLVEQFPDDPSTYSAVHPAGEILVGYRGSDYSRPQRALFAIVQERELRFEVALLVRDLRHHTDAYPRLEAIRQILTGFRPGDLEPVWCERDGFVRESEGVWQYSSVFRGKAPALQFDLPGLPAAPGEEPL